MTERSISIHGLILPPSRVNGKETSYHIYPLRVKNVTEEQRDAMIDEISKQEVAVNVHFVPMPMLTYFKELGYDISRYPQSYQNYSGEISLPVYPQLKKEEVEFVVNTVITAYDKVVSRKSPNR